MQEHYFCFYGTIFNLFTKVAQTFPKSERKKKFFSMQTGKCHPYVKQITVHLGGTFAGAITHCSCLIAAYPSLTTLSNTLLYGQKQKNKKMVED